MKIELVFRSGETELYDAPAEILVSTAGIVSICERSGEITYRDWATLRSIHGVQQEAA